MTPLSWLVCGIVLIILEVAAPGFVICFFGLGAILTAFLLWLSGVLGLTMGIGLQAVVFALSSVLFILLLRKFMKRTFVGDSKAAKSNPDDDCLGEIVIAVRDVSNVPGGRVTLYGTEWSAVSAVPVPKGGRAKVVEQNNLTLTVEPIDA